MHSVHLLGELFAEVRNVNDPSQGHLPCQGKVHTSCQTWFTILAVLNEDIVGGRKDNDTIQFMGLLGGQHEITSKKLELNECTHSPVLLLINMLI